MEKNLHDTFIPDLVWETPFLMSLTDLGSA
jgi:hypothetical protein